MTRAIQSVRPVTARRPEARAPAIPLAHAGQPVERLEARNRICFPVGMAHETLTYSGWPGGLRPQVQLWDQNWGGKLNTDKMH
jgi:hypothetical protein